MASIMTNASAMTALQTLRRVTGDLESTQDRISTGLKVAVAKDNAAYWSISSTMKSDIAGFKSVSDALGLGASTAIIAAKGADDVKNMLTEMKEAIVTAQSKGTDPKFLQDSINHYISQIESIVNSASFNGDNWLSVNYSPDGSAQDLQVDILATLSRTRDGVTPSYISFTRQDMRSDSILGRATIEQEVDSTVAAKASLAFDVGTSTGVYINGQNLGLDKLSFKFTTEPITVNYATKGLDALTGNFATAAVDGLKSLEVQPITVDIEVDLSDIVFTNDQATTEGLITKKINDAIATQSYAAMLPKVVEEAKTLAVAAERERVVSDATKAARTAYLGVATNANDYTGADAFAESVGKSIGAAFDRGDGSYQYMWDHDGDAGTATQGLFAAAVNFSASAATAASIEGAKAAVSTTAAAALGTAPTAYTAGTLLTDRLLSASFATVDGKRQLGFTVAGGYKPTDFTAAGLTVAAATDPTNAANKVADTNYTSKIEQLWVGTKESDAFGGLAELKQLDVVNNAVRSLEAIEGMLTKVISKGAAIGSIENRISIQTNFLSGLTDAVNKGIGLLVDADMNEESSRLQALQVQQQLAIQALSIANQGPQNILSLFR